MSKKSTTTDRMIEKATEAEKVETGDGAADEFYAEANEEVTAIAKMLIDKYHQHLQQARIKYLFDLAEEVPTKGGKECVGYARKTAGLLRLFADADFLIVLHGETWQGKLSAAQKAALVDHELTHLRKDDQGKWVLAPHDIEEFPSIIERHGFWRHDIKVMAKAVQMELDLTGGTIESRETLAPKEA